MQIEKPTRQKLQFSLTGDGYMHLLHDDAEHFFPEDTLLTILKNQSLFLLPTRGAAAGGLMLKRRNLAGDRSLLVSEVFEFEIPAGTYTATWNETVGGLEVAMNNQERHDGRT